MDGTRQRLEAFQNKLVDARRRGFHFEQVRSGYVMRWQSYERGKKSADRQTAFCLYIVDIKLLDC